MATWAAAPTTPPRAMTIWLRRSRFPPGRSLLSTAVVPATPVAAAVPGMTEEPDLSAPRVPFDKAAGLVELRTRDEDETVEEE